MRVCDVVFFYSPFQGSDPGPVSVYPGASPRAVFDSPLQGSGWNGASMGQVCNGVWFVSDVKPQRGEPNTARSETPGSLPIPPWRTLKGWKEHNRRTAA